MAHILPNLYFIGDLHVEFGQKRGNIPVSSIVFQLNKTREIIRVI